MTGFCMLSLKSTNFGYWYFRFYEQYSAQLVCEFVSTYAKIRLSHGAAHKFYFQKSRAILKDTLMFTGLKDGARRMAHTLYITGITKIISMRRLFCWEKVQLSLHLSLHEVHRTAKPELNITESAPHS